MKYTSPQEEKERKTMEKEDDPFKHINDLVQAIIRDIDSSETPDPPNQEACIVLPCTFCGSKFMTNNLDRKRCPPCQTQHFFKKPLNNNNNNLQYRGREYGTAGFFENTLVPCPECGELFNAYLKDGRVFAKCYKCYVSSIKTCQRCDRKAYYGYSLCRSCYEDTKPISVGDTKPDLVVRLKYQYQEPSNEETELRKCGLPSCANLTRLKYCVPCSVKYSLVTVKEP